MKVTKFNKGEMYWYINPDVKKENYLKEGENQDFLDNRPVLIISNYIDEYNSSVIIIPTTTSPHRNGINIDMENSDGNVESTNLMPMKPRWVPIKYLKTYIGRLDSDILDEVYDALDFHLGRTSVMPNYVVIDKDIHNKISMTKIKKDESKKVNNETKEDTSEKKKPDVTQLKVTISKNNKFEDIVNMRKSLEGRINILNLKSEKDVRDLVYDIKNINKKAVKKAYESVKSFNDKYLCINGDNKKVAKIYSTNINRAIVIKNICITEIAVWQLVLINKLLTHSISITNFSLRDKIVFLTIENSELKKYIKKGETLINNYKSQFLKEIEG